jgi:ABC-type lipoprotein export system ATPase subunit
VRGGLTGRAADAAERGGRRRPRVGELTGPGGEPPSAGAQVRVEHAGRRYGAVDALRDANVQVAPGEFLAITGRSGSGKSTLLNLIGGLEQPTHGRVLIDGRELWREPRAPRHRRALVGFVFQQHHLLVNLTAQANVEVALIGAGMARRERRERARELLAEVGLAERADHDPSQLSGGERQRVAIARALANEPRLLLADEPTGAVDSATSQRVLDLLGEVRARRGMTMIVVSYDPQVGERADRMVTVTDGVLTQL